MRRAILAVAAASALAAGCGAQSSNSTSTPAASTPPAPQQKPATSRPPAIFGDPYRDGRYPAALGRSAAAFFTSYMTYVYGHGDSIDRAAPSLRARITDAGPVPGLEHLTPRVIRLLIADQYAKHANVTAIVDDGRRDGSVQQVPAEFRRINGQWLAVSVAGDEPR